jgi:hypothetical protein
MVTVTGPGEENLGYLGIPKGTPTRIATKCHDISKIPGGARDARPSTAHDNLSGDFYMTITDQTQSDYYRRMTTTAMPRWNMAVVTRLRFTF